ncbi:MAG: NAD(P)-dependent alcohol dehydrogenase [Gammaproteobacteria bacterium]|nr:NAD(P)-dependent alcohol dehydrogenase [Pseudomonadales bacterium]MCP5348007.1 NAD(P)-dependent alcohol dehydrogenase [Pseudomonadales bacterium]
MKAAIHRKYGTPDIVSIEDVPCPEPAGDEIQVQVVATSINDYDWGLISGRPLFIRLFLGLFRPRIQIAGCDIAGRVVKVGDQVTRWHAGDEVYGDLSGGRFGGFAETVCCKAHQVASKPAELSFEDAAGIPQAAVLAWQGLNSAGPLRDGLEILINGAGGGVGSYGLQLAKQHQVNVAGVDSGSKLAMMQELGFDQVIDYRQENFARLGQRWDLIVDTKTCYLPGAYCRALKPGGTYATVGGSLWKMLLILLTRPFYRLLTGKNLTVIALRQNLNLDEFSKLAVAGKLRTVTDGPYPFAELPQVLNYYLTAAHQGKIIIRIGQNADAS